MPRYLQHAGDQVVELLLRHGIDAALRLGHRTRLRPLRLAVGPLSGRPPQAARRQEGGPPFLLRRLGQRCERSGLTHISQFC